MSGIPDIMDDKRPILEISSTHPEGAFWSVNDGGITKIEPYEEHGWGSMVTWFAVYAGDEILFRVPAATMVVQHMPTEAGAE